MVQLRATLSNADSDTDLTSFTKGKVFLLIFILGRKNKDVEHHFLEHISIVGVVTNLLLRVTKFAYMWSVVSHHQKTQSVW